MKKKKPPVFLFSYPLIVAILLLILPGLAAAQSHINAWRTYDKFDGVTGDWVYAAAQSSDASLWFGSDEGIMRYDGDWQAFTEVAGQPVGSVLALLAGEAGELWAGTTQGVMQWQGQAWTLLGEAEQAPRTQISALARAGDGTLWAGGPTGLFQRPAGAQQWQRAPGLPAASRLAGDGDRLWAAQESALYLYEAGGWREIVITQGQTVLRSTITALLPDGAGGVWLGTEGQGLGHFDGAGFAWQHTTDGLSGEQILGLAQGAQGELWVGFNGGGVGRLHQGQWQILQISDGLAANVVTSVLADKDGILWFGTVAGISRYDARSWALWSDKEQAPTNAINSMTLDRQGRLWAAAEGQGLYRFDGSRWQRVAGRPDLESPPAEGADFWPLPTSFVQTVFMDAVGQMWVGMNGGGAARLAAANRVDLFTAADGLAENIIRAIAQTPDGVMWFGSYRRGLSRWDGRTWQTLTTADGLVDNAITALYSDHAGRLWVGTEGGLSLLEQGVWRTLAPVAGLARQHFTAIAQAPDGAMWFGTWGGGAVRLVADEWRIFSTDDGLLTPGVEAIWPEPQGERVWFGVSSGLSVYDGKSWQGYSVASGIAVGRVSALRPDPAGGLFVGASAGVAHFLPDRTPPTVTIASINGVLPGGGSVKISPESTLRLVFSGRDLLTEPAALFYRYRLAGVDAEWRVSRSPQTTYPPLPEGTYTFEVMARDASMNYSASERIQIVVEREPIAITLPWIGPVRFGYVLGGVALLTLITTITLYAVWSTLTRLAMQRQAVERRFNPYIAGSPLRDANMFYGRQRLLNQVESALHQNSIMIHGERRIGKTSLLYQIRRRLEERHDPTVQFLPIFIDLEGTPEPEFFHRLMEGVIEALAGPLAQMPSRPELHYFQESSHAAYSDRNFRRDLRDVIEFLKEFYHRMPRLIFILDEADIMNTYDALTQQQLRRILQDTFAQNVGAVVAGVNINKVWDRVESPWYNMFLEIAMQPLDREEAEKLMRQPVARFYTWQEDAIHYVYAQSQGKPHRIQQICLEAVNTMLDNKRRVITIGDVQEAYKRVLFAEGN